jgi:hypothetical protein
MFQSGVQLSKIYSSGFKLFGQLLPKMYNYAKYKFFNWGSIEICYNKIKAKIIFDSQYLFWQRFVKSKNEMADWKWGIGQTHFGQ